MPWARPQHEIRQPINSGRVDHYHVISMLSTVGSLTCSLVQKDWTALIMMELSAKLLNLCGTAVLSLPGIIGAGVVVPGGVHHIQVGTILHNAPLCESTAKVLWEYMPPSQALKLYEAHWRSVSSCMNWNVSKQCHVVR